MPAVLVINHITNVVTDGRQWINAELVRVAATDSMWGWRGQPHDDKGELTVAQINAFPVVDIGPYSTIRVTDSGTITTGTQDVVVEAGDSVVWQQTLQLFQNFGPRDDLPDAKYHIYLTDKEPEEVEAYTEAFNKKLGYESLQFDPGTDMRRVRVTNERVSASGNNGFTEQGVQDLVDLYEGTLVSFTISEFVMDAVLPADSYEQFQEDVQNTALRSFYRQRRWYITAAGMTALSNAGGYLSGTALQLSQYLRDGILD